MATSVSTELSRLNQATVEFNGQSLVTIQKDDEQYVAIRPIVEGMGLDWKSQHRKLYKQADKFNCVDIDTVARDGKQRKTLCIPLKKLNGWLFSINPQKVRPEIKETVELYQNECFLALYNYWNQGYAVKTDRHQVEQPNPKDQQLIEAYLDTISILKKENQSLHEQLRFMMGEIRGYKEIAKKLIPHHKAGTYQNPIEVACGNKMFESARCVYKGKHVLLVGKEGLN